MKQKSPSFEKGDILLLDNGRIVRLEDVGAMDYYTTPLILQYIDRDGATYEFSPESLDIEKNLGQSEAVLASFYSMRSVHLRLNRANIADERNKE